MSERDDKRPTSGAADLDDAPPTPDEVAAAERLREALATELALPRRSEGTLELVDALRAAWSPSPLDERAHAEMLDDLPVSDAEMSEAAKLAESLDAMNGAPGALPEIVGILRAGWNPPAISDDEHRRIVRAATRAHGAAERRAPRTRRVAAIAMTTFAMAAGLVFWLTAGSPAEVPLARARSTTPLFDEPFRDGEGSARIDRIAIARAADYRDNRFAKWGLR